MMMMMMMMMMLWIIFWMVPLRDISLGATYKVYLILAVHFLFYVC